MVYIVNGKRYRGDDSGIIGKKIGSDTTSSKEICDELNKYIENFNIKQIFVMLLKYDTKENFEERIFIKRINNADHINNIKIVKFHEDCDQASKHKYCSDYPGLSSVCHNCKLDKKILTKYFLDIETWQNNIELIIRSENEKHSGYASFIYIHPNEICIKPVYKM